MVKVSSSRTTDPLEFVSVMGKVLRDVKGLAFRRTLMSPLKWDIILHFARI